MKVKRLIQECLSQLSTPDRNRILLMIVYQNCFVVLEVIGLLLVGVLSSLSISYLSGYSENQWLGRILSIFGFDFVANKSTIILFACIIALIFILKTIFSTISNLFILRFLAKKQAAISHNIFKNLGKVDYEVFKNENPHSLVYAVTDGVNCIISGIIGSFIVGFAEFVLIISIVLVLFFLDPIMATLIFLYFALILYLLNKILGKITARLGARFATSSISSRGHISALIFGYKELKILAKSNFFAQRFHESQGESSRSFAMKSWVSQLPKYVYETALVLMTVGIVIVQVNLASIGQSIPMIMIFLAGSTRLIPSLLRMQTAFIDLKGYSAGAMIGLQLIKKLNDAEISLNSTRIELKNPPTVEVRNLTFGFSDENDATISGISLTIPARRVTAIVGPSGSGKTTLIDLLLGIYSPKIGTITINDGYQQYDPSQISGSAYVPQSPYIFDGTIRDNIALGTPGDLIDDRALNSAITSSNLNSFITSLPDGISTNLGSLGSRLSGGEKQRIAIARALYSNPKFLIIDEGTSALDGINENIIMEVIYRLSRDVTIIIIAHRLSTIKEADIIYFLKDGQIQESGSFNQLLIKSPEFAEQVKTMNLTIERDSS